MKLLYNNRNIFDTIKNEYYSASIVNLFVNNDAEWDTLELILMHSLEAIRSVSKDKRRITLQLPIKDLPSIRTKIKELKSKEENEIRNKILAAKAEIDSQLSNEVKGKTKAESNRIDAKRQLLLEEQAKLNKELKELEG
jgi:hypothetical protein